MKFLRKMNESFDRSIALTHLGFLKDIFSGIEDETGIDLEILFYSPLEKVSSYQKGTNYQTIDVNGESSSFYSTVYHEFGYFSIGNYSKMIIKSELKNEFDDCIERINSFFNYKANIASELDDGYLSVIISLEEPFV